MATPQHAVGQHLDVPGLERDDMLDDGTLYALFDMMGDVDFYSDGAGLFLAVDLCTPDLDRSGALHVWRYSAQTGQVEFMTLDGDEYTATVVYSQVYVQAQDPRAPAWRETDPGTIYAQARPLLIAAIRGHGLDRAALGPLAHEIVPQEVLV